MGRANAIEEGEKVEAEPAVQPVEEGKPEEVEIEPAAELPAKTNTKKRTPDEAEQQEEPEKPQKKAKTKKSKKA
jgi:hypothetical protein